MFPLRRLFRGFVISISIVSFFIKCVFNRLLLNLRKNGSRYTPMRFGSRGLHRCRGSNAPTTHR